MTQPVVIDRQAQSDSKLSTATGTGTQSPPPVTSGTINLVGQSIGNGVVKYGFAKVAMTGATNTFQFVVSKPFRLVRCEFMQQNSSGVADTTGIKIALLRSDATLGVNGFGTSGSLTIFGTGTGVVPSTVATDSVVFVGGIGFEYEPQQFLVSATGQNNDNLFFALYIQYL